MKRAVVTGAFGFAGANLVEYLLEHDYTVYAVGRPGSAHNDRFQESEHLKKILLEMEEYDRISEYVESGEGLVFFHLSWGGARDSFDQQYHNVEGSLKAMDSAISLGARFVGIGSQAEYGITDGVITEETRLDPYTAYGACKAATYHLLKRKAEIAGIDFIWGRIFSLIGKYEPEGRMLPDLVRSLRRGEAKELSSCRQYWDYLDARDAAEAIALLGERGRASESYNIAHGAYRPLADYVSDIISQTGADAGLVRFGRDPDPFLNLRPSVTKLKEDTGWTPRFSFEDSVKCYV